jgi:anti-anti-sigma factor
MESSGCRRWPRAGEAGRHGGNCLMRRRRSSKMHIDTTAGSQTAHAPRRSIRHHLGRQDVVMNLSERRIGSAVVIAVTGRLDHGSAMGFETALQPYLVNCRTDGDTVVLDFSGVDYISSVGLRVLLLAAKRASAQGGTIAVASLQPVVREIFEISKFTMVIRCYAGVRDALAALSPAALAVYGT